MNAFRSAALHKRTLYFCIYYILYADMIMTMATAVVLQFHSLFIFYFLFF